MRNVLETIEMLRSAEKIVICKRNHEGKRVVVYQGSKKCVPTEHLKKEVKDQRYCWSSEPHWELEIK